MAGIALKLVQLPVTLLFVFLDNSSVIANCRGVRRLASLTFRIQTKIFLRGLTQSLAGLAVIFTITVSGKEIILFSVKVLLVLGFFLLQ